MGPGRKPRRQVFSQHGSFHVFCFIVNEEVETWTVKANEGAEESQLKLGKHYLTLTDSGVDVETNSKLAILWLTKASKQGNDEATNALEKCLEDETGI